VNLAKQCACGQWFSDTGRGHTACKTCRIVAAAKAERRRRRAPRTTTRRATPGTLEWAEARGGLIGGYEED
jgi:hypothetical protein